MYVQCKHVKFQAEVHSSFWKMEFSLLSLEVFSLNYMAALGWDWFSVFEKY